MKHASPNARFPDNVLLKIFEHLECIDIVKSQSVCRRWHEVICWGSPKLRRALLLTPFPTETWDRQLYIDLDLNFREKPIPIASGSGPETTRKVASASAHTLTCHTLKYYRAPHAAPQTYLPHSVLRLPLYDFGITGSRVPPLKLHPVLEDMGRYMHLIDPRFARCNCSKHAPDGPCLRASGTFPAATSVSAPALPPECALHNAYISMPPLRTVWINLSWLEVMMGSCADVHQGNRERVLGYLGEVGRRPGGDRRVAGGSNLFGGASWRRVEDVEGVKVVGFLEALREEIGMVRRSLGCMRGREMDVAFVH
ncbi:hypothetical protein K491DRAFT_715228 [Lophiostoma macrostomum CBS 122681]|uniref:F-box domain-containing protein n=1 Tax=Lophiostoma macrostomum CBS 122681 TaxID=1314788 RepID=A0A6A6TCH3_9PLEO|nr:hypothetical protein K491DRAFT_715228 [Lophiostoma macrostomum CBS 122681]